MSRYTDRKQYFEELARTSSGYYFPYVSRFLSPGPGVNVLEIGCGEGGNLVPFARAGCPVKGVDISRKKIENARIFFGELGLEGDFECTDILESSLAEEKYDLVIVKDVIEHIEPDYKGVLMAKIKNILKPGGVVFIGFPAWQMPFGGHQQICSGRFCSHLPWIHLLPSVLYRGMLRLSGETDETVSELMSIRRSKVTVESFESLCARSGFRIADRELWLVNPHYKVKFGLRPGRLSRWISGIPRLRNFFSTSCHYILEARRS